MLLSTLISGLWFTCGAFSTQSAPNPTYYHLKDYLSNVNMVATYEDNTYSHNRTYTTEKLSTMAQGDNDYTGFYQGVIIDNEEHFTFMLPILDYSFIENSGSSYQAPFIYDFRYISTGKEFSTGLTSNYVTGNSSGSPFGPTYNTYFHNSINLNYKNGLFRLSYNSDYSYYYMDLPLNLYQPTDVSNDMSSLGLTMYVFNDISGGTMNTNYNATTFEYSNFYFGTYIDSYIKSNCTIPSYYNSMVVFDISVRNPSYSAGYIDGYNNGQQDINSSAVEQAYEDGYRDGENQNYVSLYSIMGAIVDTPFYYLKQIFSYTVFGVNVYSIIMSLVAFVLVITLIKKYLPF